jgi:hypothetical protein
MQAVIAFKPPGRVQPVFLPHPPESQAFYVHTLQNDPITVKDGNFYIHPPFSRAIPADYFRCETLRTHWLLTPVLKETLIYLFKLCASNYVNPDKKDFTPVWVYSHLSGTSAADARAFGGYGAVRVTSRIPQFFCSSVPSVQEPCSLYVLFL